MYDTAETSLHAQSHSSATREEDPAFPQMYLNLPSFSPVLLVSRANLAIKYATYRRSNDGRKSGLYETSENS
jgi:hypothetical protein